MTRIPTPSRAFAMTVLTALARTAVYLLLFVGVPGATAITVTHYMLDDTDWTDPQPAKPRPTLTPKPKPSTKPEPTAKPKARSTTDSWTLGGCVTPDLRAVDCALGELRVSGVVRHPGPRPCKGVLKTIQIRYVNDYALCLTTY